MNGHNGYQQYMNQLGMTGQYQTWGPGLARLVDTMQSVEAVAAKEETNLLLLLEDGE